MQALLRSPRAPLLFSAVALAGLGIFILAVAVLMGPATGKMTLNTGPVVIAMV